MLALTKTTEYHKSQTVAFTFCPKNFEKMSDSERYVSQTETEDRVTLLFAREVAGISPRTTDLSLELVITYKYLALILTRQVR